MSTVYPTQLDYLFETSWEVCNKVGGIHTVIATKALSLQSAVQHHIFIGPDVWRSIEEHPEFMEDPKLFKDWKDVAERQGLRTRIGHWNVLGKPIAILIDFTPFFSQKDEIFSHFWEKYRLDSISGQWDYIEPCLFGYVAGKVIESFSSYNIEKHLRVAAHFHEWMTASGVLYLKENYPSVATIFTTHATVLGRCIAGNDQKLYSSIKTVNPDAKAREFNVMAKHSLEKIGGSEADCFTTVSDLTAVECEYFLQKKVDLVTPNGFEKTFVPQDADFENVRKEGRKRLLEVASAVLAEPVPKDALFVGIGGRYEFKNKGIDVFIDALSVLRKKPTLGREIIAFILVPGGHVGPKENVLHNLSNPDDRISTDENFTTHTLRQPWYDPCLQRFHQQQLDNAAGSKVKVIFCPSYLNGDDGVFNLPYYNLLIGMDLSVFPSYYEPWGYTPLESLAFKVPTITTTLAGFGLWVKDHLKNHPSTTVIPRTDNNDADVVHAIVQQMLAISKYSPKKFEELRQNANDVADIALWKNLISYYFQAYHLAMEHAHLRTKDSMLLEYKEDINTPYHEKDVHISTPNWRSVIIHKNIPQELSYLEELSHNLWWSWNPEASQLFSDIDQPLWIKTDMNPISLLGNLPYQRYNELSKDKNFIKRLQAVYAQFQAYMAQKSEQKGPKVAYYSMEFGVHSSLRIYSGGLGILAGDYLKEASDKNTPIVGIGLLYRFGYFTQKLTSAGEQTAQYDAQDLMNIPATPVRNEKGEWINISIPFPGRNVVAKLWRVDVGRTELYLLDTYDEANRPEDRAITDYLYGGDWENRLKQEIVLGMGGTIALKAMGIRPDLYHLNEGHAAFAGLARILDLTQEGLSFGEAKEVVRASSLFTTHTPVPAGHDAFSEDLIRIYLSQIPEQMKTNWERFMRLGKLRPNDPNEKFNMSNLACNLSQEVNGVSMLHGKVSQEIFADLWPGYLPEELHIGYVTNGVHYDTWASQEWKEIHKIFGEDFQRHHYDKSCFEKIYEVDDKVIWDTRTIRRKKLIEYVKERFGDMAEHKYYTPKELVKIKETLDENILTIGFARRFATYKRAHLLFRNIDRLNEIVNNPKHPVQFIFAGKAHPADKAGQDLIRKIIEISKYPQFQGKIVFLENYDMRIAAKMVKGVDIWMNTPTRPLEASGTSGEKAVMNGVMNLSVLDGWWVEGYREDAGWALPHEDFYQDPNAQDELDSETIYNIIENEIAPLFYDNRNKDVPGAWVGRVKNCIAHIASDFTMNRQLLDYEEKFYSKLFDRSLRINADNYRLARIITAWKRKVSHAWNNIEVISTEVLDNLKEEIKLGQTYTLEIKLNIAELDPDDIGVEQLMVETSGKGKMNIVSKNEFECIHCEGQIATYQLKIVPDKPGVYQYCTRLFAKNALLPHRQDFSLVKWI